MAFWRELICKLVYFAWIDLFWFSEAEPKLLTIRKCACFSEDGTVSFSKVPEALDTEFRFSIAASVAVIGLSLRTLTSLCLPAELLTYELPPAVATCSYLNACRLFLIMTSPPLPVSALLTLDSFYTPAALALLLYGWGMRHPVCDSVIYTFLSSLVCFEAVTFADAFSVVVILLRLDLLCNRFEDFWRVLSWLATLTVFDGGDLSSRSVSYLLLLLVEMFNSVLGVGLVVLTYGCLPVDVCTCNLGGGLTPCSIDCSCLSIMDRSLSISCLIWSAPFMSHWLASFSCCPDSSILVCTSRDRALWYFKEAAPDAPGVTLLVTIFFVESDCVTLKDELERKLSKLGDTCPPESVDCPDRAS